MKKLILFLTVISLSVGLAAQNKNIPASVYGKKLPYTWEMMTPTGRMIFTIHENGQMTSQTVFVCSLCSGTGVCRVCAGTGSQYWYGIGMMPCGNCGGRRGCPACSGKGYSVLTSTTTESGLTITYDERGNRYVSAGESIGSSSGSSYNKRQPKTCGLCNGKGWVPETKGTVSFGYTKYCKECDKTVESGHYHATCPSCNGKGQW